MGLIPEEIIDQVRLRADLAEIVGEVVPLKRAGRLWQAPCPFHQETKPSFTIYQEKQIFKCFGCNAAGNVFAFVMRYYNLDFPEAVRWLGERYGIEIPDTGGGTGGSAKREKLFELNEFATKFFKDKLKNLPSDSPVRKYLSEKRKLSPETIERFDMGYAPAGWENLLNELKRKKFSLELASQLGLLVEKEKGRYYDRFRQRVMFTFRASAGKVIGFSGRVITDDEPKYLNSPESRIFKKGSNFFGINLAGRKISQKDRAIVCEGNFDVVAMHQFGFNETLAVLGTALTEKHVLLLGRYTTNVYLLFDGDDAGIKAMWRSVELFLPSKVHPRVVILPKDEDPDSYLNKFGGDSLEELLGNAPLAMDYAVRFLLKNAGNDVEKKTAAIDSICKYLLLTEDPVRQDHYIRMAAEVSNVKENAIRRKLNQKFRSVRKITNNNTLSSNNIDSFVPDTIYTLAAIVLLKPVLAKRAELEEVFELLSAESSAESILSILQASSRHPEGNPPEPSKYLSLVENAELSSTLTTLMIEYEQKEEAGEYTDEDYENIYHDLITKLKITASNQAIERVKADIIQAKKANDIDRLRDLYSQKAELERLREETAGDFFRNK